MTKMRRRMRGDYDDNKLITKEIASLPC